VLAVPTQRGLGLAPIAESRPIIALVAILASAGAQSAEEGAEGFEKCRTCHQVGENAKNLVGPIFDELFGRKAGSIEGLSYSDANKRSGVVWANLGVV
jgi:cytochrome c